MPQLWHLTATIQMRKNAESLRLPDWLLYRRSLHLQAGHFIVPTVSTLNGTLHNAKMSRFKDRKESETVVKSPRPRATALDQQPKTMPSFNSYAWAVAMRIRWRTLRRRRQCKEAKRQERSTLTLGRSPSFAPESVRGPIRCLNALVAPTVPTVTPEEPLFLCGRIPICGLHFMAWCPALNEQGIKWFADL